ncbi:ERMES complex subunit mmm1 [Xylographa bjoerkii]|nr:ERMES complex subunit mmm1 [Xylographa bjoerkii]MCJ1396028.1 ERMES complex subunit mmm1 [Xylographa bjoerkii]
MNAAQNAQSQPLPQQSSLSFTQGFLLGQLSIVILIGAFIKFFIFGEPPSSHTPTSSFSVSTSGSGPSHHIRVPSLRHKPSTSAPATILAKTYYNTHAHQPESLDWFNVLIAQTIAQFRSDAHADNAILTSLTALLNGPQKPEFLASIKVTEINLGEEYPIFSNCRVHPVEDGDGSGGGRLQAWMDVDLSDAVTLGVETTMVLNFPKERTAVLPVALSVSVVRFSGTLSISFVPVSAPASADVGDWQGNSGSGPTSTHTPTSLAFSFLPNYTLSLSTRSLLGSRSRLQDVPKIAQLVESRLRMWFEERCVQPRMQQVAVPNLWPRMKNVVEREGGKNQGPGLRERDLREEALREVEDERRERDGQGLRWRGGGPMVGRSEYEMPGPMPGMMAA